MRACAVITLDHRMVFAERHETRRSGAGAVPLRGARERERAPGSRPAEPRSTGLIERPSLPLGLVRRTGSGPSFGLPVLRAAVLFLDACIDLFPVNLDLGRRLDAELHLTGSHLQDGDLDRITDPNVLA